MSKEDGASYAQIRDALETAAEEAKPDWIDRDIISKAQEKLENWIGVSMPEAQLDLFAVRELDWEVSDYPADREWREKIGTAQILYK